MNLIVCDKCFNIPKIIIINKNKIELDCQICNNISSLDIEYFNKFINVNENDELFTLPNCNYRNHEAQSILYCFKCNKYLCNDCLNRHNEMPQGREHTTIKQKISHQYFCSKRGHEENILNRFCLKCNNYLCCDCKCEHKENDKYLFDDTNKINEIKNNVLKCDEIIKNEERYFNNMINKLKDKIEKLTNLFNDYKKRNCDLIKFYKLLLDNFEKIKNIKNYNVRNNIILNNNFNLNNSEIYSDECLISKYNRLSEFYRNTNHIKTQESVNYTMTPKYCYGVIKKCLFLNSNLVAFCFDEVSEKHICFLYKNKNNEFKTTRMYYNEFIRDIYPLNENKYLYLFENNKLCISSININNKINSSTELSFKDNINHVILDMNNKNNFFTISNSDKSPFFILKYYMKDKDQNKDIDYESSLENKENMYLILKEYKNFNENLFKDINAIIENSSILNFDEKNELNLIFKYENENDVNIQKLINSNNKFLNFIKTKNENIYNKIKNKINIQENKYAINSNYIMKLINNLNQNNLEQNEKNEINYIYNINKLSKEIIDKYIPYLVFNSNIFNVYNYKNKFLFFMGEDYLLIAYSLIKKNFLVLETSNLIQNNNNKYKNFEILENSSDKIIINNSEDNIINIIEYDNSYNFCLVKNFYNYYSNVQVNQNYLLFDKKENNKLLFKLINLNNYTIENNYYYDFCELLNFKINNNPPKIKLNKNFSKFIYLFEDNNQISLIDFSLNKKLKENENKQNLNIKLKKDNLKEVIPVIYKFSSCYDNNKYRPEKILDETENYFCTKKINSNSEENIVFKFDREYCFNKISIFFPDSYKKARLKQYTIIAFDIQERYLNSFNFENEENDIEYKIFTLNLDTKAAYLKFNLLKNFGEEYFCIKKIKFFVDITHSVEIEGN